MRWGFEAARRCAGRAGSSAVRWPWCLHKLARAVPHEAKQRAELLGWNQQLLDAANAGAPAAAAAGGLLRPRSVGWIDEQNQAAQFLHVLDSAADKPCKTLEQRMLRKLEMRKDPRASLNSVAHGR